jgi:tetratricopeptide (TPR) repeat protein
MEDFDLGKMDLPYLSIVNNFENYSIYPYYNSIISTEKNIFRMPYLNHFGFISYWRFFESCSSDSILSNMSLSYDYMSKCALGFFTKYLKSDPSLVETRLLDDPDNDYIQPVTLNFTIINTLCNTLLDNNLDLAARLVEENKTELFAGENQLNLLARMFNDKDIAIWLYQKSLKYNPDSWETHYNLGSFYKENGEPILATNALLRAQEINPENTKITDLLNEISREE